MSGLRHRLSGWFWDHSQVWRRPVRRLRQNLSAWRYRLRHWRSPQPPRVLVDLKPTAASATPELTSPALGLRVEAADRAAAETWMASQTEASIVLWPAEEPSSGASLSPWPSTPPSTAPSNALSHQEPTLFLDFNAQLETLPATLVESLLLAAACEGSPLIFAAWAPPAQHMAGPDGRLWATSPLATLWRLPSPETTGPIVGRVVPHVTDLTSQDATTQDATTRHLSHPPTSRASGPYLLRGDISPGTLVRQRVGCPAERLAALEDLPGPPTVLFLLPFLAVGGAERLLFDLLAGLRKTYRCLVVTLEPHDQMLGNTLDTCRRLIPHLYTLGDWLPRACHAGAIEHLLRRYRVESLVCWNGVVAFYDQAADWKRRWPELRIYNQLYNHRGGWIEHYGPRFAAAIDVHLAVNGAIADALIDRGIDAQRVATVPHGVEIPELPSADEPLPRRHSARRELGLEHLPPDTVVVGTFIRLHPQKRPFDILETARRLSHAPVHFLLVGGGPLADAVDQHLADSPLPNLSRFGLRDDLETLYAATDICLMTSEYEGLPIFLLDGLARGLPCVATAVGDIPSLLQDGGGVLVEEVGDVAALAAAVEALLDEPLRRRQGRRGRETVGRRFGLEAYRRRYEELIFPSKSAATETQRKRQDST